jgi:hypothetical protein
MNLSFSKSQTFTQCGLKYYFRYVEKLEPIYTFSALSFGIALDQSLNFLLECKRDGVIIDLVKAKDILTNHLDAVDPNLFQHTMKDCGDDEKTPHGALRNLKKVGQTLITIYAESILPQLPEIYDVQVTKKITNQEGDTLVAIIDLICTENGNLLIFDNKTTSDINKYYGEKSVLNSDQLTIYTEMCQSDKAGFIAIDKSTLEYRIITDTISEARRDDVFSVLDKTLRQIKSSRFQKNLKSCFLFGRKCEYFEYCKHSDKSKLRVRE